MNEATNKAKAQIVEKLKASTNVLITVSRDPSVDALSAALGLTALLNKIGKHATAIFSGAIPPAIDFLEPGKTFENTADSLRDFIIALDKEKADHLRYKVDGDVVKIFITPYRTTITGDDLQFSQGDFNVELVLALGVDNQEHLDAVMAAQGQLLKDVTVATFSAGDQASKLGSMDWREETASGQSEMVAGIADVLKTDKTLLDKQIATALLTGIVAATDRFSNVHTSSQVMATAAQLMAAGADQQLIAAKLQESHEINALPSSAITESATALPIAQVPDEPEVAETPPPAKDGISIPHGEEQPAAEASAPVDLTPDVTDAPTTGTEPELTSTLPPEFLVKPETPSVVADSTAGLSEEPLLGGILNATSDQAAEDAQRQLDEQQNKTILTHSYLEGSDSAESKPLINSASEADTTPNVDIFSGPSLSTAPGLVPPVAEPNPNASVSDVNTSVAPPAAPTIETGGLPLPPPLPDFSTLPPPSAIPAANTSVSAEPMTSTLPPPPNPNDPSQFQIPV